MTLLAMMTRARRVLASPRSLRLLRVITTAVAVIVSPTKVAATKSRPKVSARLKLTAKGTAAPTTATQMERFRASKNSWG